MAFYLDTLRLPIGDAQAPLERTQALLTPKQHGAGSPDSANLAPGGQLSLAFDQLEIETVAEYNDIRETACDPPGPLIEEAGNLSRPDEAKRRSLCGSHEACEALSNSMSDVRNVTMP